MGIRDSLSRLKKKLDSKSRGKRKPDGAGSGTDGEGVDLAGSLPLPARYAVAGGSNVDGRQGRSTDRLPQLGEPEFAPGYQEGGETGADEGGASQRHSNLQRDAETVEGSGPGREASIAGEGGDERGYPSPSTPSIQHRGTPIDGT